MLKNIKKLLLLDSYKYVSAFENSGTRSNPVLFFFKYIYWYFYQFPNYLIRPLWGWKLWAPFSLSQFLESYIRSNNKRVHIFEYGSGSSTVFFSKFKTKVVSIEYDLTWYEKVKNKLKANKHVRVEFVSSDDGHYNLNDELYFSNSKKHQGQCFKSYVKAIEICASESFDIIFIDGRSRAACVKHSIDRLNCGGLLVLDDTDRVNYADSEKFIPSHWTKTVFKGAAPWSQGHLIKESTVWQKSK